MTKQITINELSLMTGLSTRTLRNYLTSGILHGTKSDNRWLFNEEEVTALIRHPSVYPSILAKNKAIIQDFLKEETKSTAQSCLVMDLPAHTVSSEPLMQMLCECTCTENIQNMRFSYEKKDKIVRIIVSGPVDFIVFIAQKIQLFIKENPHDSESTL